MNLEQTRLVRAHFKTICGRAAVGFWRLAAITYLVTGCEPSTAARTSVGGEPGAAPSGTGSAPAPSSSADPILSAEGEGPTAGPRDPTLGGPCLDDPQCDDGLDCTFDVCELPLGRCRFTADHSQCQDALYCNGSEQCLPNVGCRPGEPVTCDDQSPCTLDQCIEGTRTCQRSERDLDQDGDADRHCMGGGDCDEDDPAVSSEHAEVCANSKDDNCDGQIDESECVLPEGDDCENALRLSGSQTVVLQMAEARSDTTARCARLNALDKALIVEVPERSDVLLRATGASAEFSLAARLQCDDPESELLCELAIAQPDASNPWATPPGAIVARLRDVPAGDLALWLWDDAQGEIELQVELLPLSAEPANEGCENAELLLPDESKTVDLLGAQQDAPGACSKIGVGDLLYQIELPEPADLEIFAISHDRSAEPLLSLRSSCDVEDELQCSARHQTGLFARALPAGTYYVAVSATLPAELDLVATVSPATQAPQGESCQNPVPLERDQTTLLDLSGYAADHSLVCGPEGRDAVSTIALAQRSDVLVKARLTVGDSVALALLPEACEPDTGLSCTWGMQSPLRAVVHNLLPGNYQLVSKSALGNPVELLLATRPAGPPVAVAFADTCDDALSVPSAGGYFTGNTALAGADWTASCDVAGASLSGAADQILSLTLDTTTRVILDASGSAFPALINLRRGDECPGEEVDLGCVVVDGQAGGFVDLTLTAGQYWIQVDGLAGEQGQWDLEVFLLAL